MEHVAGQQETLVAPHAQGVLGAQQRHRLVADLLGVGAEVARVEGHGRPPRDPHQQVVPGRSHRLRRPGRTEAVAHPDADPEVPAQRQQRRAVARAAFGADLVGPGEAQAVRRAAAGQRGQRRIQGVLQGLQGRRPPGRQPVHQQQVQAGIGARLPGETGEPVVRPGLLAVQPVDHGCGGRQPLFLQRHHGDGAFGDAVPGDHAGLAAPDQGGVGQDRAYARPHLLRRIPDAREEDGDVRAITARVVPCRERRVPASLKAVAAAGDADPSVQTHVGPLVPFRCAVIQLLAARAPS